MAFWGSFVVLSFLRWQQPRQCDPTYTAPEASRKIPSPKAASCDIAVQHLAPDSREASYDLPLLVEKRRAIPPSQATAVDDTEEEEEEGDAR